MAILYDFVYTLLRKPFLHRIKSGHQFLLLREEDERRTTYPKDYKAGAYFEIHQSSSTRRGLVSIIYEKDRGMNVPSTMQDQKRNTIDVYSDPSFVVSKTTFKLTLTMSSDDQ